MNQEAYIQFMSSYKNLEQVQRFGVFIGKKELFSLSKVLKEVLKDESKIQKLFSIGTKSSSGSSLQTDSRLRSIKQFTKRWFEENQGYSIPDLRSDKEGSEKK